LATYNVRKKPFLTLWKIQAILESLNGSHNQGSGNRGIGFVSNHFYYSQLFFALIVWSLKLLKTVGMNTLPQKTRVPESLKGGSLRALTEDILKVELYIDWYCMYLKNIGECPA
jgi:hypothetical protein